VEAVDDVIPDAAEAADVAADMDVAAEAEVAATDDAIKILNSNLLLSRYFLT
jgi:hypothetical protein